MQISNNYFKPLNQIVNCNFDEIKCNAMNVFIIATYFSLIVPAIFLLASCLNGRVKPIPADTHSPRDKELSQKILEDNAVSPKKADVTEQDALFEQGLELHRTGNRKEALAYFKKAADKDHVEALYYLGKYNQFGTETKDAHLRNWDPAIPYYKKAAELGHTKSQYRLAEIYRNRSQLDEALKYYIPAAENKNKKAQYSLAQIYRTKDPLKALSLLNESAEQNYHAALHTLGGLYERGEIVQKDIKKAIEYYHKAMDQGSNWAAYDLAHRYLNGENGEQDLEKAVDCYLNIKNGPYSGLFEYEVERRYLEKAAKGDVQAFYRLGQINQFSMFSDYIRAIFYYKKAADCGHRQALTELMLLTTIDAAPEKKSLFLGAAHEFGAGVDKDTDKAIEHYKMSAEKGNKTAQLHLAEKYHYGQDVDKNIDEALKYYIAAAGSYAPDIHYTIAKIYEYEKQDIDRALIHYTKAAHAIPIAMVKMAVYLATGHRIEKDLESAKKYLDKAEHIALHDDTDTLYNLAWFYLSESDLKDLFKAKTLMTRIAAQGYEPAIKALREKFS